jgi:hypothetical protein
MRAMFVVMAAIPLAACLHVKNQLYNPASPGAIAGDNTGQKSVVEVSAITDKVNPACDPFKTPCMAFLEFDEMGEMWDPAQLGVALRLIEKAKTHPHPIIVTFTHGWKNNALDDRPKHVNGNVSGFEGVLDLLKDSTKNGGRFPDSPVVGIYIGWRGNLVSEYWPVRQQFSYFNREGAAIRIPGASLTAALTQIMETAHSPMPKVADAPPVLVIAGHSFGGLIMERALTQAMTDYVLRGGTQSDGPWADLVVFVNSAAAASEGKQMLNLLKSREAIYRVSAQAELNEATSDVGTSLKRTSDRPLFLSISSVGDAATRFGLVIGHGPSAIDRDLQGSWRTYTHPEPPNIPSQQSFYLSTTAHLDAVQSHLIVEAPAQPGQCGKIFGQPVEVSVGGNPATAAKKSYVICEKPNRWNDTPYWAMEMPATIVPDHSGIFNSNFVRLLIQFLPSYDEMANPADRPRLSTPAAGPQSSKEDAQ